MMVLEELLIKITQNIVTNIVWIFRFQYLKAGLPYLQTFWLFGKFFFSSNGQSSRNRQSFYNIYYIRCFYLSAHKFEQGCQNFSIILC